MGLLGDLISLPVDVIKDVVELGENERTIERLEDILDDLA